MVAAAGPRSLLPKDYFEAGDGLLVKQIFEAFDRDEDGLLNQEEYGAFCAATEGAGCDDKRWAAHSKSLGSEGTPLKKEDFAKLYTEARFKKHFGKQQQDLEAAQAAPKSDAASEHFDEMEEKGARERETWENRREKKRQFEESYSCQIFHNLQTNSTTLQENINLE